MDAAPIITSVTSNTTGSGHDFNYSYCVRANYSDGSKIPSPLFFATDLTDNLGSTTYNIIAWNIIPSATSYDIYRCWTNGPLGDDNTTAYGLIGNTTGNTFSDVGQGSDNSLVDNSSFIITIESVTDSTHIIVNSTADIVANDEIAMDVSGEETPVIITSVVDGTHLEVSNSATLKAGAAIVDPATIVGPVLINM